MKRINCQYVSKTFAEQETTADGWLVWRGNHYYINRNPMSMEDARTYCKQRHGDLVSFSSKAENVFLWKQVGVWALFVCTFDTY